MTRGETERKVGPACGYDGFCKQSSSVLKSNGQRTQLRFWTTLWY